MRCTTITVSIQIVCFWLRQLEMNFCYIINLSCSLKLLFKVSYIHNCHELLLITWIHELHFNTKKLLNFSLYFSVNFLVMKRKYGSDSAVNYGYFRSDNSENKNNLGSCFQKNPY